MKEQLASFLSGFPASSQSEVAPFVQFEQPILEEKKPQYVRTFASHKSITSIDAKLTPKVFQVNSLWVRTGMFTKRVSKKIDIPKDSHDLEAGA